MNIKGLQKTTLLDYPGKVAATIFIDGCNFCCPFCQNADLVLGSEDSGEYSLNEIKDFLNRRKNILDGICVTGGEPLLHPEVEQLITMIKTFGYMVKLDTNGSRPDYLKHLVKRGLIDYVAMDIKNSKERYAETIGKEEYDLAPIEKSVEFLKNGTLPFEFRTTVVKEFHDDQSFEQIADWLCGDEKYVLQDFVDSDRVICENLHGYERPQMLGFIDILKRKVPNATLRNYI